MGQTLDMLLKLDRSKIKKPEKSVEIKRLSELSGSPVIFICEAVMPDKMQEIQDMVLDVKAQNVDVNEMQLLTILAGVKEPSLKDKDLMDKFGVPTPKELILKLFLPGEISNLYGIISGLSGYGADSVTEIKNL